MKTATIEIYHVFGTKALNGADVWYRGKLQHRVADSYAPQRLLDLARMWAYENGFTHVKVRYVS